MSAQVALADKTLQMNNGMTCFRNDVGVTYGCAGGVSTGDSGFNDVKTGEHYKSVGGNQAIDTRTGQVINTPQTPVNPIWTEQ